MTKSAIPDAPLSIFNRGLAHRFGLRRWAMVSPHKAQRSVAKLAQRWHRRRHRFCPVDRHRALPGNPNDYFAGLVAVGSAVKGVA